VIIEPTQTIWDGLADPERAEFVAALDDDRDDVNLPAEESTRVIGAEAAIAWGRERAVIVLITLDGEWDTATSFSAGVEPGWIPGMHDAPLSPWPGIRSIPVPPGGWHEADDPDDLQARVARFMDQQRASGPHFFEPLPVDPNDLRNRPEPPASTKLHATFKWEETGEEGEDIGPLIVYDPELSEVVWESTQWLTLTAARSLAEAKGWRFGIDG
jgi:hypothetical protein